MTKKKTKTFSSTNSLRTITKETITKISRMLLTGPLRVSKTTLVSSKRQGTCLRAMSPQMSI